MDSKKLAKIVKAIVSAEVKRQLPVLVEQEVNRRMKTVLTEVKKMKSTSQPKPKVQEEDMFSLADQILQESRNGVGGEVHEPQESMVEEEGKHFSKNPIIDKILKQTQPFSASQRTAGSVGFEQNPRVQKLNEASGEGYEEYPTMGGKPVDSSDFNMAPTPSGIPQDVKAQMAAKMGYGDISSGPSKTGLGVTTGLPALDRVLNRDNSELVKQFKR
jgi:hypothetical protein